MKTIPLSQGNRYRPNPKNKGKYFTQVDDEDYDELMKFKWSIHFAGKAKIKYAVRTIYGKKTGVSMHRQLLKVTDPKILVDHADLDGLNNQKYNLRIATRSQNNANKNPSKNGTSKYLGVCIHYNRPRKDGSISFKYYASIRKDKKKKYLGVFDSEENAALAYDEAAKIMHGEFANLNFP